MLRSPDGNARRFWRDSPQAETLYLLYLLYSKYRRPKLSPATIKRRGQKIFSWKICNNYAWPSCQISKLSVKNSGRGGRMFDFWGKMALGTEPKDTKSWIPENCTRVSKGNLVEILEKIVGI